jgi:surfactin synthase thioesterase subunit
MAYMNQKLKAELVALAKPILKKYGVKATFAVDNHSTIVCNIWSGPIDFDIDVENSDIEKEADQFMKELRAALNTGNHNNSRIEVDYFDVGWYVTINVGKWNKPYKLVA